MRNKEELYGYTQHAKQYQPDAGITQTGTKTETPATGPASKDISCLFLSDPDCRNRFIRHTLTQSSKGRRPGGRAPKTDKTKAGS